MKDLNNRENSDFEKSWKDAFEGAELEPSEDVWLKVDGVLANQEANGFKKTIVYYKYAAAVSLLLLLSTALLSYLLFSDENTAQQVANNDDAKVESTVKYDSANFSTSKDNRENKGIYSSDDSESSNVIAENRSSNKNNKNEIAENVEGTKSNNPNFDEFKNDHNKERDINHEAVVTDKNKVAIKADSNKHNNNFKNQGYSENQVLISQSEANDSEAFNSINENNDEHITRSLTNYAALSPLTSKSHKTLAFTRNELQYEVYRVPVVSNKKDKKDETSKGYFAGLQFSPGYFDPNIQINSLGSPTPNAFLNSNRSANYSIALANQSADRDVQPQVSYTYGLNFGFKLAKRWLINMGLQYSKNNTSGTTSQVFTSADNKRYLATPSTLSNYASESTNDTESMDYNLPMMYYRDYSEVYEFTSVPVKAGYVIVDKRFTWIISTGVATDLFIQSKSHDPSGNFDDLIVKSGESTDFKKVFFNGLGSSELIYNLNKNYSLSIEPSFRAAISSFSKTESLITSHPKSFGIAAGFRYNF